LEELAEAVGVSRETIGKIERGTAAPLFETAERIALALDVSASSLFTERPEPKGERGRLLISIYESLSKLNEQELSKLSKIVSAFVGK